MSELLNLTVGTSDKFFQESFGFQDVALPLLFVADFTLDHHAAFVVHFLQLLKDPRKSLAFAYCRLRTKLSRIRWEPAIFCMDASHTIPEHLHCIDRIPLSIHDEIGDIEVHKDISDTHISISLTNVMGVSCPVSHSNIKPRSWQ